MKLKDSFITYTSDGENILIDAGGTNFVGLARSNKTAAFIVDSLKAETTQEAIVAAMCAKYDAPRDVIAQGVEKILGKLRSIGALDE